MKTNQQLPEPRAKSDGSTLDFHSMFFTIQGEGPFAGHRSIFVRLAGCNLQCPGCDTEYTEGRKQVDVGDLILQVDDLARQHVGVRGLLIVITGGEPLRQTIGPFVRDLLYMGYRVQIESNGVFPPDGHLHNMLLFNDAAKLVISPKTKRVDAESSRLASCFKYVLDADSVNPDDGLPIKALDHPASTGVARPPLGMPVYLNPFDAQDEERNARNLRAVADSCLQHGYILGVQLHKLIGLE